MLPTASHEALRRAYREAVLRLHPDRHPDDPSATARFQTLAQVWSILGDPARRASYDAGRPTEPPGHTPGGSPRALLEAALDAAFGVADRRLRRGRDLRYELTLTLPESARGARKTVTVPTVEPCAACGGRGFPPGTVPNICHPCAGSGEVRVRGALRARRERCPDCAGRGYVPNPPCPACGGAGVRPAWRSVEVPIPPGTRAGARLLVRGAGEPGLHGGPPGDLTLTCSVTPHPTLRRQGAHVLMELAVSALDALLGATITVPTVHGPRPLEVPAGTPHGAILRLPGLGVAPRGPTEPAGDQLVTVRLTVPPVHSDAARVHLEAARALLHPPNGGPQAASDTSVKRPAPPPSSETPDDA